MKPNLKAQFEPLLGLLLSCPLVALLNSDEERAHSQEEEDEVSH